MIPVNELLNDITEKVNKNANLQGQFIPDENLIDFLNRGQLKLVLKKLGLNNSYQSGLDSFKKRYEDLQVLIVPYEKLTVTLSSDTFNSSKTDLTTTVNKYFLPIDAYILCTRNNCKDRILDIIKLVKHGDIQTDLKSPHWKPSFSHQESLGSISNNIFYTYPDEDNSFTINSLYLSYLRYPTPIDVTGYTHLDGTASTNTNCELDYYLKNELLEITIEDISDAIGDKSQSQLSRDREQKTE